MAEAGQERAQREPPLTAQPIEEIAFDPARGEAPRHTARRLLLWGAGIALTLTLVTVLWFVFTARSVHIDIDPRADRIEFESGRLQFQLEDRYLVRPGPATVRAEKAGYYPLVTDVVVGDDSSQVLEFSLRKKPGRLTVGFDREVASPQVIVDGGEPWDGLSGELEPGEHDLEIRAPRFQTLRTTVEIEGGEVEQDLIVSLVPNWADVTFASTPQGAEIVVDGEVLGTTPGTVEILAGDHDVTVRAAGHKPWRRPLRAVATVPQAFQDIVLDKADGLLSVTSSPVGASVAVGGRYRGQTPLELRLPPGRRYTLELSKAGFAKATRRVDVRSDQDIDMAVALEPLYGTLRFDVEPAGAQVLVDGQVQTLTDSRLRLPAVAHRIEVRAEGYVSESRTLTPNPGYEQTFRARLLTREAAREAAIKKTLETSDGQVLVLMRPQPFTMGASRRERGRRANEVLRQVNDLGEFYISTTEVTNKQFRAFKPDHDSGYVYKVTLNDDELPVVNVSWLDAARYCNWLSEKDGLEPAYRLDDGRLERTGGSGYRLPTEAEWAWAARFAGNQSGPRYAWGNQMPPAEDSGNYADRATIGLTAETLKDYNDGYAATAPVGSFPASDAGLYDIGGNVSEWIEDEYTVGVAGATSTTGSDYRVVRGSSWMHSDISELRLTYRDFSDVPRPDIGFRIARDLEEPKL